MILFTHALVGGAVAAAFPTTPTLGIIAAFISHFVLDVIPHWDYAILSESANPKFSDKAFSWKNRLFLLDLMRIALDAILGFFLTLGLFLYFRKDLALIAAIGALFAILPDFLQFVYRLFPHSPIKYLQQFHSWVHSGVRYDNRQALGISLQAGMTLIVVAILYASFFSPHAFFPNTSDVAAENAPKPAVISTTPKITTATSSTPSGDIPPQFVLLAFDGSKSIRMWKNSRAFAKEIEGGGGKLHFTYFVSAAYLLTPESASKYQGPYNSPGKSLIGFADSTNDVASRLDQINAAHSEGHEIGGHAVGHFDGSKWTTEDWKSELQQFRVLLSNVVENNPGMDASHKYQGDVTKIVGFRAPQLGHGPPLFEALPQLGYRYDTSLVGKATAWPTKNTWGTWEFPLAAVQIANPKNQWTISMDYNFFVHDTKAQDIARKGTPLYDEIYRSTKDTFDNYFKANYEGNRAPVYMGNHFSLWNDGVYWEVMKDFARDVCVRPDVRCISYNELADYLEAHPEVVGFKK